MKIIHLADATEYIPMLAKWFNSDWPPSSGGIGPPTDFEHEFRRCARKSELPLSLVAIDNGDPIGTVILLEQVARADPSIGPWVEGLFVVSDRRHRGVALALVAAAVNAAGSLGFQRVFIGVRAARDVYEARGWRHEHEAAHPDGPISVLSTWTTGRQSRRRSCVPG